jgi:uncharacterized protein YecE (DUF72 family)
MGETVRVGCSGFQKSRAVYFQNFNLVEIQQTFYKPPKTETAARWREEAPNGFIFTIKAWQVITHEPYLPTYRRTGLNISPSDWKQYGAFRKSEVVEHAWQITREIASILETPVILFQCPPQFNPTPEHIQNLREFFHHIDRGSFLLAWEPRGYWPDHVVKTLCMELDLIHAVDPFLNEPQYGSIQYFRLHGGKDYSHVYTVEELERIAQKCVGNPITYCLFNNVNMWQDGLKFADVSKRSE